MWKAAWDGTFRLDVQISSCSGEQTASHTSEAEKQVISSFWRSTGESSVWGSLATVERLNLVKCESFTAYVSREGQLCSFDNGILDPIWATLFAITKPHKILPLFARLSSSWFSLAKRRIWVGGDMENPFKLFSLILRIKHERAVFTFACHVDGFVFWLTTKAVKRSWMVQSFLEVFHRSHVWAVHVVEAETVEATWLLGSWVEVEIDSTDWLLNAKRETGVVALSILRWMWCQSIVGVIDLEKWPSWIDSDNFSDFPVELIPSQSSDVSSKTKPDDCHVFDAEILVFMQILDKEADWLRDVTDSRACFDIVEGFCSFTPINEENVVVSGGQKESKKTQTLLQIWSRHWSNESFTSSCLHDDPHRDLHGIHELEKLLASKHQTSSPSAPPF